MTENEAIKRLKEFGLYHAIGDLPNSTLTVKAFEMAIEALKEIQQYRAIGTVERFQQLVEQFKPHVTDKTSCKERHCNKCDKYRKENEKYHEIGTVEECREARERQRGKKPILSTPCKSISYYLCPNCKKILRIGKPFCCECGSGIDWSEEDV